MNTQPLLGFVPEQHLAVTAAKQKREPVQVATQLVDVVGPASHEVTQRLAKPSTVGREPVVQKPQQLSEFGRITDIQGYPGSQRA